MKEGWTYKKVKEVCDKASSTIVLNKIVDNTGDYPLFGASGFVKGVDFYHREKPYIGIVKDGAGVGRVNAYPAKSSLVGTMQYILPKDNIQLPFLCYALQGLNLAKLVSGATIPHIYFKDYGEFSIPVPPIETQSQIVSELDLLQSIIDKQQAQLKELDNLAQAIFYDMFGDPNTNTKGWVYHSLAKLISDSMITYHLDGNHGGDYPKSEEFVEDGVPYIGANCIVNGNIDFSLAKHLTIERANKLRKGIATNNDVLFAHNATVGPVAILKTNEEKVILSTSLTAFRCNEKSINPYFLKSYMVSEWFVRQYIGVMKQTTRNQVPITKQKEMLFITPPISLQQSFAAKIESIEKQKSAISKSIEETQKLFDYTMDKYFG